MLENFNYRKACYEFVVIHQKYDNLPTQKCNL